MDERKWGIRQGPTFFSEQGPAWTKSGPVCPSSTKQCDTKHNNSPPPYSLIYGLPDVIEERSDPYIKTFSTLLRVDSF